MRLSLVLSGLVSLVLGLMTLASPAVAQTPPALVSRITVAQRVELLPREPVCWNLFRASLPPGTRSPVSGYAAEPLSLGYTVEGTHHVDYAGGPMQTFGPGQGFFVGQNNWHAHHNPGPGTATALVFAMTCQPLPPGIPGLTQLGTTAPLTGLRPDTPYTFSLIEYNGPPGAQLPVHMHAGPETVYVWEGSIALSMQSGISQFQAGFLGVIPPGTAHQPTNIGSGNLRLLVVSMTPAGETLRQDLPSLMLPLPSMTMTSMPAALPRTGESVPWASMAALAGGAALMVVGLALRRRPAR